MSVFEYSWRALRGSHTDVTILNGETGGEKRKKKPATTKKILDFVFRTSICSYTGPCNCGFCTTPPPAPNSQHWFTTSCLQPLPYLVTPYGPHTQKKNQLTISFFVGTQTVVSLLQTTQIKQDVSFITANKVYTSTNKTTIVGIETELLLLFFIRDGCVSCLRACLGARLLPQLY